jgi:hypothetical protein
MFKPLTDQSNSLNKAEHQPEQRIRTSAGHIPREVWKEIFARSDYFEPNRSFAVTPPNEFDNQEWTW